MSFSGFRRLFAAVAVLAVVAFALASCSDDDGAMTGPPPKTERDAYTKWYVQQAVDRYEDTGRQATIDYYNNEAGSDDEWYIFITDLDTGNLVAHATIPSRVGTNSSQRVDVTGYAYGPVMMATDEDGQWVDYVFYNPQTGTGATKHGWVIRRDNLLFGSGWYEDYYPAPPPTKDEPGSYTRAFVEEAVWFYESEGIDALIEHINDPESTDPMSIDDQWYVFVLDLDGEVLAHPTVPENVGQMVQDILGDTPEGAAAADKMITATETGIWVDYTYLNPQSGYPETKHSWMVKRDDVIIASGWYESPGN